MATDWQSVAKRLIAKVGLDWLSPRVRAQLTDTERPVFVACSGGADSVFLLLTVAATRESFAASPPVVLHFDHRLRGEASAEDARFVEALCAGLELECRVGQAESAATELVSEEQARVGRLGFFADVVESRGPIFTGHHGDDIAEWMLMRLARGSGLEGLCSPKEISPGPHGLVFVRPLLGWRKARIVDELVAAGADWREDASNESGRYHRNRLRNEVIPLWERLSDRPPQVGVARSRALLEEDWEALEACFEAAWKAIDAGDGTLSRAALAAAPAAFRRRAIRRLLAGGGWDLAAAPMEQVLGWLESGADQEMSVGTDSVLVLEEESVFVLRAGERKVWEPVSLPVGATCFLPEGGALTLQMARLDEESIAAIRSGAYGHDRTVFIDPRNRSADSLVVRMRRPGDAYRPKGKSSPAKLKDLLADRKISPEDRRTFPVVAFEEGSIVWMPGLPPAADSLIADGTTTALRLTYL